MRASGSQSTVHSREPRRQTSLHLVQVIDSDQGNAPKKGSLSKGPARHWNDARLADRPHWLNQTLRLSPKTAFAQALRCCSSASGLTQGACRTYRASAANRPQRPIVRRLFLERTQQHLKCSGRMICHYQGAGSDPAINAPWNRESRVPWVPPICR